MNKSIPRGQDTLNDYIIGGILRIARLAAQDVPLSQVE